MSPAVYKWVVKTVNRRGKTHKQRYRVRDRDAEPKKPAPLAVRAGKTLDHHWIEREVTRGGKVHRQWFKKKGPPPGQSVAQRLMRNEPKKPDPTGKHTASELFDAAQSVRVSRRAKTSAHAEITKAIDGAVKGKSLKELHAIPFSKKELKDEGGLQWLRKDPHFRATGNVRDNFGSSREGLPQITIERDGKAHLTNGRHRITVARELGMNQIVARVRKMGQRGAEQWEYIGMIKV